MNGSELNVPFGNPNNLFKERADMIEYLKKLSCFVFVLMIYSSCISSSRSPNNTNASIDEKSQVKKSSGLLNLTYRKNINVSDLVKNSSNIDKLVITSGSKNTIVLNQKDLKSVKNVSFNFPGDDRDIFAKGYQGSQLVFSKVVK
tara:strand:- start:3738 stop:4172 length:435 start_codon:yes stop_codon:yes gene_type:complete